MEILIRKGNKSDLPRVLELIKELALYEKAPQEVTNTVEDMERDGFGENPVYGLLVGEVDGNIEGMAIYYIKYSTWKGKCVYLDDIVVTEKMRGKGIGKKLFDEVIEECKKLDCRLLWWQVLEWNSPAIHFYEKYNATFDPEWLNGKLVIK